MIIFGIDPGSRLTGYGVIQVKAFGQYHYLTSGCIHLDKLLFSQRLHTIFAKLHDLVQQYKPQIIAIERVFLHTNPQVALKLGQARGAAIVGATSGEIPLTEYSVKQIKQSVVGYGSATKQQVQDMVCRLLNLNQVPSYDAADALAIAICHAQHSQVHPLLRDTQCIRQKFRRGRRR
jgi:crossover junction endodeoxyribonuclease RuvC